jgi:hypothetical protein
MSESWVQLEARRFTGDWTQPPEDIVDAGAHTTLEVDVIVLKSGSGGNFVLEHASEPKDEAFQAVSGVSLAFTSAEGRYYFHVPNFLRYLRVKGTGVGGNPVVGCLIVGK